MDGFPATHEERCSCPKHHRGREQRLDPAQRATGKCLEQAGEQVTAHRDADQGSRERCGDPQAPPHVAIFLAGPAFLGDRLRLQRHPADRATARPLLPHLRMHRAGEDGIGRTCRRFALGRVGHQIALGFVREFRAAAGRAEVVGLAGMIGPVLGRRRVDLHPADGVGHRRGLIVCRSGMLAARSFRLVADGHCVSPEVRAEPRTW